MDTIQKGILCKRNTEEAVRRWKHLCWISCSLNMSFKFPSYLCSQLYCTFCHNCRKFWPLSLQELENLQINNFILRIIYLLFLFDSFQSNSFNTQKPLTCYNACSTNHSKNIQLRKDINISQTLRENQSTKVIFWKDFVFPLKVVNWVFLL